MLKGLIFDLDGTLVDSLGTTFEALNFGLEKVGLPRRTPHEIMEHFGFGEDIMFKNMIGEALAPTAYQASVEYMQKHAGRAPFHSGIPEVLRTLKEDRIPISIVTGRSWGTTEIILRHLGVLSDFVTVIAYDHVQNGKPDPEGICIALKRMGLTPSDALYIGDSPVDILAARSAGCGSVAVTWDWFADQKLLSDQSPDHWAKKPSELLEIWRTYRKE